MSDRLKLHLSKLKYEVLKPLVGDDLVGLLTHVGDAALDPKVLAEIIIASRGAEGILKDATTRDLLITNLENDDVTNLCEVLGTASDVPRMTIGHVDFAKPAAASTLFQWYGVAYAEDNGQREPSRSVPSVEKLRLYQENAYQKLRRSLEVRSTNVLVHMPFGAGKLRTVVTAVLEALRSEGDGSCVLWLASGACLCEEALADIEAVWQYLGLRDMTSYLYFGGRRIEPLDTIQNAFVVADIRSLHEALKTWSKPDAGVSAFGKKLRSVVLADAEQLNLPEVQDILQRVGQGHQFNIVGITASPRMAIEASLAADVIQRTFADNIIEVEEDTPLAALRHKGEVDPIDVYSLPSPAIDLEGSDDPIALPDKAANGLALHLERNKFLLAELIRMTAIEDRIVFYATTAQQARLFASLLTLQGRASSAITGALPLERRVSEMTRFNNDLNKQILCVHGALVSASLVDRVTAMVVALPSPSSALIHEMVGRLAFRRRNPENPLKVYFVRDPVPGFLRLVDSLDAWDRLNSRS
ncbi:DEAD/DEAH box helicase family protein [Rhizobium leguminosarum]|uniref:DEAD/DEAH box helicase family protein n=1 Tax=Rhizobium leguminosarum TaxID=384 RepID=UPI00103C9631|nr:DEAD/DEAH box helicase family protein [Rhizobium leguminosarum]TBY46628.1 hypothetical protein E0H54_16100 [Rhizobium leguminosarum bv. viciae]